LNSSEGAAEAAIDFLAKEGSSLNNRFDNVDEALEFFVTRNAGGRRKPGEESKAREVIQRFNIGDESTDDTESVSDKPKKDKIRISPLSFLDPIISLARGEMPSLQEETDRIKDIMKKIL
jgi:hypothetical protein